MSNDETSKSPPPAYDASPGGQSMPPFQTARVEGGQSTILFKLNGTTLNATRGYLNAVPIAVFDSSTAYPVNGGMQPIPVEAYRPPPPTPPSDEFKETPGRIELHASPSCLETVSMLPFPFFCLGCFISRTADIVFDDETKSVTFSGNPGYLFCLKKSETISYDSIGNVALVLGSYTINDVKTFELTLLLKDGRRIPMTGPQFATVLEPKALALHRFLFARGNPMYRTPILLELVL